MSSSWIPWPDDWPAYRQECFSSDTDNCDMLEGPCRCGAWHTPGEFVYEFGVLTRRGEVVETQPRSQS